jgi:hypothetical protein
MKDPHAQNMDALLAELSVRLNHNFEAKADEYRRQLDGLAAKLSAAEAELERYRLRLAELLYPPVKSGGVDGWVNIKTGLVWLNRPQGVGEPYQPFTYTCSDARPADAFTYKGALMQGILATAEAEPIWWVR